MRQAQKQQKATVASGDAAKPAARDADEIAPFPRGGGSALTPLEFKAIAREAKEDALFGKTQDEEDSAGEAEGVGGGGMSSAASRLVRAHALHRKELVAGVRLLGAVTDVSSDRLLLQLPNHESGRVDRAEVSDELYETLADESLSTPPDLRRLFHRGEVLCCVVLPTASRISTTEAGRAPPPVELSLRLSLMQKVPLVQVRVDLGMREDRPAAATTQTALSAATAASDPALGRIASAPVPSAWPDAESSCAFHA